MDGLFVPIVGRPRKIATPEKMMEIFKEYLEDRMSRPLISKEEESGMVGESSVEKEKKKAKSHPLSIGDFCIFCGCSREWWASLPEEFSQVKRYISNYIFHYQLKGAESGEFNANIVARELGLADKKQVETTGDNITIVVRSAEEKRKLDDMAKLGI